MGMSAASAMWWCEWSIAVGLVEIGRFMEGRQDERDTCL